MRYLIIVLLLAGCRGSGPAQDTQETTENIPFQIEGTLDIIRETDTLLTLQIEIADDDSTRERGMMQRTAFPQHTGMLFVFDQESMQQFWMGNTPLALQVVSFAKYAMPYSNDPLKSQAPAQYVLEVPAGWVDTHGILEGDEIRWQRY